MLLFPRSQLPELLLRNTAQEPLHAHKRLHPILAIQKFSLWPPDKLLDLQQTRLVEMCTQAIVDLLQHLLQEALGILLLPRRSRDHLIHKPGLLQLFARNPLTHDKRLVGLRDAQPLDKRARRTTLRNKPQRRERGEEESMRGGVDEVSHGDEGRGKADGGTVQGRDEDLGVIVESTGDVHVVGDEVADDLATDARAQAGIGTGAGYICSAVRLW